MSWKDTLADHYRITGSLTPLPGEYDLNLLVTTTDETRYVLKVMRPDCDPAFVELQCMVLEHLATLAPDLPVPRLIRTATGAMYVNEHDRYVWLISALPGETYATFRPQTAALRTGLGQMAARLDLALLSFTHPELNRPLKWNLLQAEWAYEHLTVIHDPDRRQLIAAVLETYLRLKPQLLSLEHTTIHNDLNDYNLLVSATDCGHITISGILDFGDLCAAPRICELAIAAAYAVLDQSDPIRALSELITGYHAEWPLTATEIDLL
jgi:Ser/Thr protein kinase RdoA (MazF antagonist)